MSPGKAILALGSFAVACSLTSFDDVRGSVAGSGGEISLDAGTDSPDEDVTQSSDADNETAADVTNEDVGVDVVVLPPDLVLAYSFAENGGTDVADVSGNGNHGVLNGGSWGPGRFGSGLTFDGSVAFVLAPHSDSLALTAELTLEAWVRPAATAAGFQAILVKNYDYFLYSMTTTNACAMLGELGGVRATSGFIQPCADAPAPPDAWTHLAFTYDADGATLYENGTVAATQTGMGRRVVSETGTLQVGASMYGEYFAGTIDEIRVYSRALTLAQIQVDMVTPLPP
jgi:hypothetical protein